VFLQERACPLNQYVCELESETTKVTPDYREELAGIYTNDLLTLSTGRRARWIIGETARSVGISREEVIATARDDTEYLLLGPDPE
jgi:hypothetical protein